MDAEKEDCIVCEILEGEAFSELCWDTSQSVVNFFSASEKAGQEIGEAHFHAVIMVLFSFLHDGLNMPPVEMLKMAVAIAKDEDEMVLSKLVEQIAEKITMSEGETLH